ncbi:nucleotide disphospho-sugar-binding domain-containing protein [Streptomyces sp. NPDC006367]|uniref:nucleotide disphospho-sugar-binding domain-containing protein n=1 Tax=unclassified Streptomyces TaxID=2593676 RepID=UPI0033AB0C2B
MRVLVTSWAWPTHYYPMAPLAWALRAAGHEVLVAAPPSLGPAVAGTGMPFVPTGRDLDVVGMIRSIVDGRAGKPAPAAGGAPAAPTAAKGPRSTPMFTAIAESMADELLSVGRSFGPDLVMFEPSAWAGPLVAAALGVPAVRVPWGADIMASVHQAEGALEAEREALAPLAASLGVPGGADTLGTLTLDACPAPMQIDGTTHATSPLRYVPYNGPGNPLPGHLAGPRTRPRVCVTWGTTVGRIDPARVLTAEVLRALAGTGLDLVAAVPQGGRAALGPIAHEVTVLEQVPLHQVFPHVDAVVGHGGAGTVLAGLLNGLPQAALPLLPDHRFNAGRLAASGAGLLLPREEASPGRIRETVLAVLEEPGHRKAAEECRADLLARPTPAEVVGVLGELAGGR